MILMAGFFRSRGRAKPILKAALLKIQEVELLKAAKHKWRVAWALRDERFEELYDFEQSLYDDGTHDAAGIQVLSAGLA